MTISIDHIIIGKENHTFDNYFGTFPGAMGVTLPQAPDPQITDPLHDHAAWLAAQAHGGGLRLQYGKHDIPAYWAFAQQYSLCDNYFTDVASQSEPNHLHLIAADASIIDNSTMARRYQPMAPFHLPNLPASLEVAGHTWRNYADARSSYFDHIVGLVKHPWSVPSPTFDTDAKEGKLPDVSWLFAPDGLSQHPGDFKHTGKPLVGPGMQWTADREYAAATGPLWAKTAIFITRDDWGGWYDHVAPPLASAWPNGGHAGYPNSQFRYGPRVPRLVVSPYAKAGINHTFDSHSSIVKFCIKRFALKAWNAPAMRAQDKAGDMSESFDFIAPPRLAVPFPVPK